MHAFKHIPRLPLHSVDSSSWHSSLVMPSSTQAATHANAQSAQEVRAFPRALLAIRAFKHIPHLLLHGVDGGDRDSACTVDLPRTGPVPDLDELEADIEVLREVDGVEWLLG